MKASSIHGDYTPAKIQWLLKEAGITQKQIAQEQECSEMAISLVVNHRSVSRRLMKAVAKHIGADYRDVFAWHFKHKDKGKNRRAA